MKTSPLLLVLVGAMLACPTHAQPPPASNEARARMDSPGATLEFDRRKARLLKAKNVGQWPTEADLGNRGQIVVPLTVRECTYLGGTVSYHDSCGTTHMKCTGPSGRAMCIDEVK